MRTERSSGGACQTSRNPSQKVSQVLSLLWIAEEDYDYRDQDHRRDCNYRQHAAPSWGVLPPPKVTVIGTLPRPAPKPQLLDYHPIPSCQSLLAWPYLIVLVSSPSSITAKTLPSGVRLGSTFDDLPV